MKRPATANSRLCVFCGLRPESKTKEHIIPKWLLEFTGDPKRKFSFGLDKAWSADSFVMPACYECNNSYATLEGSAKPIVLKLLKGEPIAASHYSVLLDWLDKIRIGLWLAFNVLDNFGINPSFYIATRAKKDRMLLVYHFPTMKKILGNGLNFEGVYSPIFKFIPSCFGMRINDTILINASNDFFISARAGFPFPKKWKWDEQNEKISLVEEDAFYKLKSPLLRFSLIEASVQLYQPILLAGLQGNNHEYVKNNLLNVDGLEGKIFEQIKGTAYPRDAKHMIDFQIVDTRKSIGYGSILGQIYSLQNHFASNPNSIGFVPNEVWKESMDWNKEYRKTITQHWNI